MGGLTRRAWVGAAWAAYPFGGDQRLRKVVVERFKERGQQVVVGDEVRGDGRRREQLQGDVDDRVIGLDVHQDKVVHDAPVQGNKPSACTRVFTTYARLAAPW